MVGAGQLDFAVNVVPGGPPGWLRRELHAAVDRAAAYPDERPAAEALAARHGRPPGEVVCANGSAEAFWLLAGVVRPSLAVVVQPSFTEPEAALRAAGRRDLPGLVVVRSLTKLWGLAGLRAGYVLAPEEIATALRVARQPWSVNALACAALAAWAREGAAHAHRLVGQVAAAREQLATALGALPGVRVWPSAANFLLLRVPDGPAVLTALAARGVAVRPCHTFPGLTPDHLRAAVRDPADNQRLVDALREVLT